MDRPRTLKAGWRMEEDDEREEMTADAELI